MFPCGTIDAKIAGLTERGFKNPQKMIESSPAILGLGFENIDRKMKLIERVSLLLGKQVHPSEIMENDLFFFSSRVDKMWVLTRIVRDYQAKENWTSKELQAVLHANLENLLLADAETRTDDLSALIRNMRRIKKQQLTKSDKQKTLDSLPKNAMLKRYFRGYPLKKTTED